jgi:hypothetical protein
VKAATLLAGSTGYSNGNSERLYCWEAQLFHTEMKLWRRQRKSVTRRNISNINASLHAKTWGKPRNPQSRRLVCHGHTRSVALLTLQSRVVIICTMCFKISNATFFLFMDLVDSQCKQGLFPENSINHLIFVTVKYGPCHGSGRYSPPLTTDARIRARVNPCGICGGQSDTGTGYFSQSYSVFPRQCIIPPSFSKLISSGECVIC